MAPSEGRTGNICVWCIAIFFFVSILSGVSILLLYILLPATPSTSAFPFIGTALIAIPWSFWILTCLYRTVIVRFLPTGPADRPPAIRVAAVAPSGGPSSSHGGAESPVDSPGGGARRVRFGNATVLGGQQAVAGAGPGGDEVERGPPPPMNDYGSSGASRESEKPLALSMS